MEFLLGRNQAFIGSAETVTRRLKLAAAEGGFNTLFAEFNIGFIEEEDLVRSIKLFGTHIIPALRGFEPY